MRMKKILAVVAAAAMTAAMSLPVYAEATPGQVANESAEQISQKLESMKAEGKNWGEEDIQQVSEGVITCVKTFQDTSASRVVTERLAEGMLDIYENEQLREAIFPEELKMASGENRVTYSGQTLGTTSISINQLTVDQNSIVLASTVNDTNQSDTGYIVEIELPGVPDGTEYQIVNEASDVYYLKEDGREGSFSFVVNDGKLTFWVPHFSTYTFDRVSTSGGNSGNSGNSGNTNKNNNSSNSGSSETQTSAAAPAATAKQASGDTIQYYTCPACGYHNWTATSEGYRCDNCGRVESEKQLSGYGNVKGVYEPAAAAVAENPIKATGSDMSLMVFAVVALAGVAACGLGVASKKSRKGE